MKNIYELGVDINSNWEFHDGDLKLISYEQNMGQAVINRLKCYLGAMNIFYNNYGSQITHYLGEINNKRTWEYIRIEIETSVLNDPALVGERLPQNLLEPSTANWNLSGQSPSILLRKTVLSLKSPTGAFIVLLRSTNAN